MAVTVLTAALLVAVLAGDRKAVAINPGRLASVHSGIAADCARCHEEGAALSLFARAGRDNPHFIADRAMANSALCLECHAGEIGEWETSARFAHGWKEKELEEKLADARTREESSGRGDDGDTGGDGSWLVWLASKGGAREKSLAGDMACAVCHQEHHGLRASLTEMSDAQCQVCHQEAFSSFEEGHPEFASVGYPYSRRTRIHFDHESHYADHFGDDRESYPGEADPSWPPGDGGQSCRMCHEPDEEGRFMKVKSYEAACAQCHEKTAVRGGQELTFLEFPGVATGEKDGEVPPVAGLWPTPSEGEAILSPTMRLLLSPETRDALRAHEAETAVNATAEKGAGQEADGAAPEEEAAVRAAVARDLQRLFRDAWESDEGSARLVERIHEGGFADEELARRMLAGLSVDAVHRLLFPGSPVRLADVDLPRLDLDTLERRLVKKGRSLGLWPRGGTPALTPVMGEILRAREGERDFPEGTMDSLLDERG